ncbi:MAG: hypothetical protein EBS55_14600, partial [Flavobacteriaceae bacterium]|nr:hypothetical protein [Flavobacteriaceae bacterium]
MEEIFKAWGIQYDPNDERNELASKRIEVCNTCPNKKEVDGVRNVCSLCGCMLKSKVFTTEMGQCPDDRWNEVESQFIKYKTKKNLRFVSAQPAIPYYTWQVEVMLNNFIEMGINLNNVDIVCWKENGVIPAAWSKLANNYAARFFFYDDLRTTKHYISSIRPNILKQHWEKHPELKDETIFYHDCDIIFTKPISEWITEEMINDDKWYGSDTRWYIGHNYIKSKGEDVLNLMCDIVGIDKKLVEKNELNSIGAQYIMKGISQYFWDRVEKECEILFKDVSELNNKKKQLDPSHHELQIWCADMWAVLWNGWKMGYETICHDNLGFSWGTSNKNDFDKFNIMHNAGVTGKDKKLFYKAG